jgi:hypothetical protein
MLSDVTPQVSEPNAASLERTIETVVGSEEEAFIPESRKNDV